MKFKLSLLLMFLFLSHLCLVKEASLSSAEQPQGLRTDLLENTDTVWLDGFPSNLTLSELPKAVERYQVAEIRSSKPSFGWIVNDNRKKVIQTAYRIQLTRQITLLTNSEKDSSLSDLSKPAATKPAAPTVKKDTNQTKSPNVKAAINESKLNETKAPDPWDNYIWDTGKQETSDSINIIYSGKTLEPDTVYYWRVQTWNNGEESPWSEIKGFKTAKKLAEYEISRYPIVKEQDQPVSQKRLDDKTIYYDFGRASFGQIRVEITAKEENRTAIIRLGERTKEGRVDQKPFGTTRYWSYQLKLLPGKQFYTIKTRVNTRNTTGEAFLIPDYIGEVMPFRYAEVEVDSPENVVVGEVVRHSAFYYFNETASFFHCDNESLNKVWHLCRWSIKAASFLGVFIDGDRERIPYGGDSLFQQLIHYGVDHEYSLDRYTQEYIIFHPTWPSECPMRAVQMAWYDYLYTGDTRNIEKYYDELKIQSLLALAEDNGLISTRKGKATRKVLDSIHFKGKAIRDLVDWPWKGFSKGLKGETDDFVFCDFNPVINAYHYFALRSLCHFAQILNRKEDEIFFKSRADLVFKSFQEVFFDAERGVYKDGDTTDHASLHANIFAMSLGVVPEDHRASVLKFIKSRGMVCSIFGAKFMLDSVYESEDGDYGLQLMLEEGKRGWLNMIRMGTTIIPEAWDDSLKPNLDWNHASGGTPGNIIPHKLVGVEPLNPGASLIRIKPQVGSLKKIDALVPIIRGGVSVKIHNEDNSFKMETKIPANCKAEVWIPVKGSGSLIIDNQPLEKTNFKTEKIGKFYRIKETGSGTWCFECR